MLEHKIISNKITSKNVFTFIFSSRICKYKYNKNKHREFTFNTNILKYFQNRETSNLETAFFTFSVKEGLLPVFRNNAKLTMYVSIVSIVGGSVKSKKIKSECKKYTENITNQNNIIQFFDHINYYKVIIDKIIHLHWINNLMTVGGLYYG